MTRQQAFTRFHICAEHVGTLFYPANRSESVKLDRLHHLGDLALLVLALLEDLFAFGEGSESKNSSEKTTVSSQLVKLSSSFDSRNSPSSGSFKMLSKTTDKDLLFLRVRQFASHAIVYTESQRKGHASPSDHRRTVCRQKSDLLGATYGSSVYAHGDSRQNRQVLRVNAKKIATFTGTRARLPPRRCATRPRRSTSDRNRSVNTQHSKFKETPPMQQHS